MNPRDFAVFEETRDLIRFDQIRSDRALDGARRQRVEKTPVAAVIAVVHVSETFVCFAVARSGCEISCET